MQKVNVYGRLYSGKALFDVLETYVRKAFFSDDPLEKEKRSRHYVVYMDGTILPAVWQEKMSTFERYFVDDETLKTETKNSYYEYIKNRNMQIKY